MHDCMVVAAARHATAEAMAKACPALRRADVHDGGGWTWSAESAYIADDTDLLPALPQLPGPSLLLKTRPWGVAVHAFKSGARPYEMVWHWGLGVAARVTELQAKHAGDFARYLKGADLAPSAATKKRLKGLGFADACAAVLADETTALATALARAGLASDAAAMTAQLDPARWSDAERASPLGPLPRLLDGLGLPVETPVDEVEPFLRVLPETAPIAGGPVILTLADLPVFMRLLALVDSQSHLACRVLPPDGHEIDPAPFSRDLLHLTRHGREVRFAFPLREFTLKDAMPAVAKLVPAFAALPDGSQMEWLTRRLAKGAGGTRWTGAKTGGAWTIDRSWPSLDASVVRELLLLARAADTREPIAVRDEAEVAAIATRMKWNQGYWNGIVRDGLAWRAGDGFAADFLPEVLAELRYRGLFTAPARVS